MAVLRDNPQRSVTKRICLRFELPVHIRPLSKKRFDGGKFTITQRTKELGVGDLTALSFLCVSPLPFRLTRHYDSA